ncbi:MAG: adenylosuccinate lyase, partial [Alphaproteobacteria bacterium]|nr:adenylosuccinate lyase [Alphaproteobacteria bacterium]
EAGMSREDAYRLVQKHAMAQWNALGEGAGKFADRLKADPSVTQYLSADQIDASFDPAYHLKHIDTIFRRVFGSCG